MKKISVIPKKKFEIFIHIISWLFVFTIPLILEDRDNVFYWDKYLKHLVVLISYCIIFYVNCFVLIPRYWIHKKTAKFIGANILFLGLLSLGIYLYQDTFFPPPPHIKLSDIPLSHRISFHLRHLLPMTFVVALSMVIRMSQQWYSMKDKLIEIENEKTEAELKNLKNQLNPHFLLNTLNNIYALISFNTNKAQEAVQELSKLLRYVLYENQSPYVPLQKELDFINNYVSLMRIRVSKSVNVNLKLEEGPKDIQISPLLFISLIENAFKHGISPTEVSFINISIQGNGDGSVRCEIKNSNYPKSITDKSGSGIGLEQVHRRLELLYPGKYNWHHGVSFDGQTYLSVLTIYTE